MFSGIRGLLFAFSIQQRLFFRYAVFHQIMALEMILKGALLYCRPHLFADRLEDEALQAIETEARRWGHDFRLMLRELDKELAPWSSAALLSRKFDELTGDQLIGVLRAVYEESRYPTSRPTYLRFQTEHPGIYRDPLNSSNAGDCIHELCRQVLAQVKSRGGVEGLGQRVHRDLLAGDVGERFTRVFFAGTERDFL